MEREMRTKTVKNRDRHWDRERACVIKGERENKERKEDWYIPLRQANKMISLFT